MTKLSDIIQLAVIDNSKFVAVIGGSEPSKEEVRIAEEVGRELAKRGATLVCGGLGGVMEAACKGARAEGGVTIGILPGESRKAANTYVQIPIVTGIGYARNVIVARHKMIPAIDCIATARYQVLLGCGGTGVLFSRTTATGSEEIVRTIILIP